jgi:hypothetical protein
MIEAIAIVVGLFCALIFLAHAAEARHEGSPPEKTIVSAVQ